MPDVGASPPGPRADLTVRLRPETPDDRAFLVAVYASTRQEELAPVPWTSEQKAAFLAQQFEAQHSQYRAHYPAASYDIILVEGAPGGRLYVDRRAEEVRVMDIALLPAFRGRGIGSLLLSAIIDEAARAALPVTMHVEKTNPALRLYGRLGFEIADDRGVYWFISRGPALA